jgi:hypothetical protein
VFDRTRVLEDILRTVGERELAEVRRLIGSETLRRAVELIVDVSNNLGRLYIPHYWAVYYHDGRGPVQPVSARKLVFFNNPDDDPRLEGGYPVRVSDIRKLTKEEYDEGLRRNAERRRSGGEPFMFVVDSVGPAGAHPFFDDLAQGAAARAEDPAVEAFDRAIQDMIDTDKAVQPERRTVFLRPPR